MIMSGTSSGAAAASSVRSRGFMTPTAAVVARNWAVQAWRWHWRSLPPPPPAPAIRPMPRVNLSIITSKSSAGTMAMVMFVSPDKFQTLCKSKSGGAS
jgi:hypothetical protein